MPILWTEEEKEVLKKLAGRVSLDDLDKVLVDRTKEAIQMKMRTMGLSPYPEPRLDREYLKKLLETVDG